MDPDIVRQQEEAEREALLAAKSVLAAPPALAVPVEAAAAAFVAQPAPVETAPFVQSLAPAEAEAVAAVAIEAPAPAKKKKPHPERRALPPMGVRGSRAPAPERIRHGILHGVARFLAYALAGAMLGVIFGNAAADYLNVSPESNATVIFSAVGCFTFICALISILHHEH
jgi:hypothetical protein